MARGVHTPQTSSVSVPENWEKCMFSALPSMAGRTPAANLPAVHSRDLWTRRVRLPGVTAADGEVYGKATVLGF